jgi:hypothetical protein
LQFRAIIRGLDPAQVGDDESFVFDSPTADRPTLVLTAGGFDKSNVAAHVERTGDVVAFGRHFSRSPPYHTPHSRSAGGFTADRILPDSFPSQTSKVANPDLPRRIFDDLPLNSYNRDTFYQPHDALSVFPFPPSTLARSFSRSRLRLKPTLTLASLL